MKVEAMDHAKMKVQKIILIIITATLLLPSQTLCQSFANLTNFTYFKTNTVNDLTNLQAAMKAYRQGLISKEEIMLVTLATLNDEPIVFYGKLEDQFGNSIGNVPISFNIRVYNGLESTVKRGQVVSDTKGFFKISEFHGQDLGFMPHTNGYALASSNTYFKYSHMEQGYFVPDPKSPIVVKMYKAQGAEPLISVSKRYKLHYTNEPICFDLIAGTIVTNGGDLQITVSRPNGIISGRNPQWWRVKFDIVNGGLMNSFDERTVYFAPENGYEPSKIIASSDRLSEGGTGGFHTGFFIKSRNGQVYSKFGVSFRINEKPEDYMYFEFNGIANTNYSRNWEGAPGTFLNPGF